ncbi:hypothetical protein [Breoghania sp.]|uniref:hypothetical protein n=1 Tax=Breoghania sp. TaxID=2065378 RepID=UPI002AA7FE20|nr:hypothetical protein [Breoghania sp.]
MTKDKLKRLFQAELTRMNAMMNDIVTAAQATGTHTDPRQLEADRINGWVYRLLEKFGTAMPLTFDETCEGRRFLEANGVPEALIPWIAETFAQERLDGRSRRFEKALRDDMEEAGLDLSRLNKERARTEIYRAKADVLLNTETLWFSPAERVMQSSAEASDIPQDRTELPASPQDRQAEPQDISPSEITISPEASEAAVDDLPVSEFMDLYEILKRNRQKQWTSETARDVAVVVRMFQEILIEHGVQKISGIRQAHVAALRDFFSLIPTNYGRSARLRALSVPELRTYGEKLLEEADSDEKAPVGLAAQTIRKHLGNLLTFRDFLAARGHPIIPFELRGLRPSKRRASELASLTPKPGPEQTKAMFRMPLFTGFRSEHQMDEPGTEIRHGALYFLPMIYVYLGMRRAEAAGLMIDEIVNTKQGWAIQLKANAIRGLKNAQSARYLPVPDDMIRLNFLVYVEKLRSLGYHALFPEMVNPYNPKADPGDRFYKNFSPLFVAHAARGGPQWNRVLHALRHGHADTLKQAGVSLEMIEDIQGRDGLSETGIRYTNPAGLPLLKQILSKYPIVTTHLEPRPIRLLSFIEARKASPWFEDPDAKRRRRGQRR